SSGRTRWVLNQKAAHWGRRESQRRYQFRWQVEEYLGGTQCPQTLGGHGQARSQTLLHRRYSQTVPSGCDAWRCPAGQICSVLYPPCACPDHVRSFFTPSPHAVPSASVVVVSWPFRLAPLLADCPFSLGSATSFGNW